jgi:hypothetical protein
VEAWLPDSWGTTGSLRFPGSTSALSRFPLLSETSSAGAAWFQAMAVYMREPFDLSTPQNDKSDIFFGALFTGWGNRAVAI